MAREAWLTPTVTATLSETQLRWWKLTQHGSEGVMPPEVVHASEVSNPRLSAGCWGWHVVQRHSAGGQEWMMGERNRGTINGASATVTPGYRGPVPHDGAGHAYYTLTVVPRII